MRYSKKGKHSSYYHIHVQFCQNKGFKSCHSIGSLIIFSDKFPSGRQFGQVSYFLLDEYPTGSAIWTGLIIGRKEYPKASHEPDALLNSWILAKGRSLPPKKRMRLPLVKQDLAEHCRFKLQWHILKYSLRVIMPRTLVSNDLITYRLNVTWREKDIDFIKKFVMTDESEEP